jgi:hypothetical protein
MIPHPIIIVACSMRTPFVLLLLAVALPLAWPQKKAPQPKPAVIQVLKTAAHRDGDLLAIDGHLKNTGERPAADLVIIVDVLNADKQTLTTQKGESEPATIEAGQEGEFHAQMTLPPKALYIRLSFEDGTGRDLKATNTGPFAID